VNNIFWITLALFSISAINSRESARVKKILLFTCLITLIRFASYLYINGKMSGATGNRHKYYCNAVYQSALYIFQAFVEGIFMIFLIILGYGIMNYIKGKQAIWRLTFTYYNISL
jgi:hypothetical protein